MLYFRAILPAIVCYLHNMTKSGPHYEMGSTRAAKDKGLCLTSFLPPELDTSLQNI